MRLRKIAQGLGIPETQRRIFICAEPTKPKCCKNTNGEEAWSFPKKRMKELDKEDYGGIFRSKADCPKVCKGHPIAVVHPEGA